MFKNVVEIFYRFLIINILAVADLNPDGKVDAAINNIGIFDLKDPSSLQTAQSEFDRLVDWIYKLLIQK